MVNSPGLTTGAVIRSKILNKNLQVVSDLVQHTHKCIMCFLIKNILVKVTPKDLALIIAHSGCLVEVEFKAVFIYFGTAVSDEFCYEITSELEDAILAVFFSLIVFVIATIHSK